MLVNSTPTAPCTNRNNPFRESGMCCTSGTHSSPGATPFYRNFAHPLLRTKQRHSLRLSADWAALVKRKSLLNIATAIVVNTKLSYGQKRVPARNSFQISSASRGCSDYL